MANVEGETAPIVRIGSSIRNLGYAQIVIMIGGVLITIVLITSLAAILIRSGSVEDLIKDFRSTLWTFLIFALILNLINILVFFLLYRSLKFARGYGDFSSRSLGKAEKLIAILIFVQIMSVFVGLYFTNVIMQDLDELANSNPTIDDLEDFVDNLESSAEIIMTNILAIAVNVIMLTAFNSIKDWIGELYDRSNLFLFTVAGDKMRNVTLGIKIIIGGQIINLITLSNFGGIVVFAGSIILVVGYVQTGNLLLSIPPSLRDLPAHMLVSPHAGYHPPIRHASTTHHQPTSIERFCTVCGSKIALGTQFCINCGTKLK
jgi:hypothetical protein